MVPGSSGSGGSASSSAASSGSGASTFTWLPSAGQTIRQGQAIYQVSGTPVVLLYGNVPAYRDLSEGMTGADVTELNTDLVRLGYASTLARPKSGWDYFSGETAYALELLQAHLGLTQTGTLALGQAVFLPGAILVTALGTGTVPGAAAMAGGRCCRQFAYPGGDDGPGCLAADRGEGGQQGLGRLARRVTHPRSDLFDQHRLVLLVLVVLVIVFVVFVLFVVE